MNQNYQHMRDIKQIIIIRKDLNMRKGKMIAQGAHASVGLILDAQRKNKITEPMKLWMDPESGYGFKKICVYVNSEEELLHYAHLAYAKQIPCKVITDAGDTEFGGLPTITCLAMGPHWSDELDPITGNLPLL